LAVLPAVSVSAIMKCAHGGTVTLSSKNPGPGQLLSTEGGPILCAHDLISAPIVGCGQTGPGVKPCTSVVVVTPSIASLSTTLSVNGKPVLLSTLAAVSDGSPPGLVTVVSPGQASILA
jgi:hypothetical protein